MVFFVVVFVVWCFFFFPMNIRVTFFAEYLFPTAPTDVNIHFCSPVPQTHCCFSERLKAKQNNKQKNNNNKCITNNNNTLTLV